MSSEGWTPSSLACLPELVELVLIVAQVPVQPFQDPISFLYSLLPVSLGVCKRQVLAATLA